MTTSAEIAQLHNAHSRGAQESTTRQVAAESRRATVPTQAPFTSALRRLADDRPCHIVALTSCPASHPTAPAVNTAFVLCVETVAMQMRTPHSIVRDRASAWLQARLHVRTSSVRSRPVRTTAPARRVRTSASACAKVFA